MIEILSLFPGYFKGPFDESIVKRAQAKGLVQIQLVDVRDFASPPLRKTDDRPYGGGPGMVMMPDPLGAAIRSVHRPGARVVYLSPQGKCLDAAMSRRLAQEKHLILICGHYEGIDERIIEKYVDEEISIGNYVLTNGCLPAIVLVDALVRFIPGVLGHPFSAAEDSFEGGLLDCPHYTRPPVYEGMEVPAVLLSGNHKEIASWRQTKAREKTERVYRIT